jgi:hypothetical protein
MRERRYELTHNNSHIQACNGKYQISRIPMESNNNHIQACNVEEHMQRPFYMIERDPRP